jgi:hypothetical protein
MDAMDMDDDIHRLVPFSCFLDVAGAILRRLSSDELVENAPEDALRSEPRHREKRFKRMIWRRTVYAIYAHVLCNYGTSIQDRRTR